MKAGCERCAGAKQNGGFRGGVARVRFSGRNPGRIFLSL
nr:MAG TPA: hypothetical protein [Caudoviricetes sp.]